jgi:hypothetical protein
MTTNFILGESFAQAQARSYQHYTDNFSWQDQLANSYPEPNAEMFDSRTGQRLEPAVFDSALDYFLGPPIVTQYDFDSDMYDNSFMGVDVQHPHVGKPEQETRSEDRLAQHQEPVAEESKLASGAAVFELEEVETVGLDAIPRTVSAKHQHASTQSISSDTDHDGAASTTITVEMPTTVKDDQTGPQHLQARAQANPVPSTSWKSGPSSTTEETEKIKDTAADDGEEYLRQISPVGLPKKTRKPGARSLKAHIGSAKPLVSSSTQSPYKPHNTKAKKIALEELTKQEALTLLKTSFENLSNCKGTRSEIAKVKAMTSNDRAIDGWCEQLYTYCLERFKSGPPNVPSKTERPAANRSPEYASCSERVKIVAEILCADKRACEHLRQEDWALRLASDPVHERDFMHNYDISNRSRARRALQTKENCRAVVEEVRMLKDILVVDGEDLTKEMLLGRLDRIEGLAAYAEDPGPDPWKEH